MKTAYKTLRDEIRITSVIIALMFSIQVFGSDSTKPTTTVKSSNSDIVIEQEIQVEDWMSDLSQWELPESNKIALEEEMEVEDWMLSASNFCCESNLNSVDTEEEIEIEDWMTDLSQW